MRLIVSELRDDMPLTYNNNTLTCSDDEEEPDTCKCLSGILSSSLNFTISDSDYSWSNPLIEVS